MADIDADIDALYQLPPEQFTAARNDLAKRAPADSKADVRALRKPSTPAWAVNQLYFHQRRTWDALIRAAQQLRDAHKAALQGRAADLRKADAAHRDALSRALKETMDLVSRAGHQPTAAVKEAVMRTLQALPADIHPGRLDAPLASAGFGVLEGITPSPAKLRIVEKKPKGAAPPPSPAPAARDPEAERRHQREAKKAQAEAEREARRLRAEEERQRREDERRAARQIAQLTAAVERARKEEEAIRERLERASRDRAAAEQELARARKGRTDLLATKRD